MANLLTGVAMLILAVTALGLFQVLRANFAAERMMAVQLLGTGGAAVMLVLGTASDTAAMVDVALLLVLLSAFSCAAFSLDWATPAAGESNDVEDSE